MADLTWSKNEGFDPSGTRVASVAWCFDLGSFSAVQGGGHSGPGFAAPRWYWEAYVARDGRFDNVLLDGQPGRWAKKDEAKAAAESSYRTWATELASDSPDSAGEQRAQAPGDIVHQARRASGVLGHLRSLVRAWRTVYRSDRMNPSP